jgi:GNAT superfamily N-acetyltransferase
VKAPDAQLASEPNLHIEYRGISAGTNCKAFQCGEREINRWFSKDALKSDTRGVVRVTCAHLPGNDAAVGFFGIATAVEDVRKLPGYHYHLFGGSKQFPCLQLVYLAVQREFQGRSIGRTMVGSVIARFAEIGPIIGLPHLILVPINDRVIPFYENIGFQKYDGGARMFLPLQTALDAVRAEQPNHVPPTG